MPNNKQQEKGQEPESTGEAGGYGNTSPEAGETHDGEDGKSSKGGSQTTSQSGDGSDTGANDDEG